MKQITSHIGFIGTGNMGEALIGALIKSKIIEAKNIYANDAEEKKLKGISKRYGILRFSTDGAMKAGKQRVANTLSTSCGKRFMRSLLLIDPPSCLITHPGSLKMYWHVRISRWCLCTLKWLGGCPAMKKSVSCTENSILWSCDADQH